MTFAACALSRSRATIATFDCHFSTSKEYVMSFKFGFSSFAIASMLVAGCAVQTAATEEGAASTSSALENVSVIHGLGGQCLDVQWGSTAWETPVQMWPCNSDGAQVWRYLPTGEIKGLGGLCLDVKNGSTDPWTPVQMYPCTGGAAQKWDVRADGTIHGLGGQCLDVRNGSTAPGAIAQMFPCTGNIAQKWSLQTILGCADYNIGSFRTTWKSMGGAGSWLGCPTGDAYSRSDGSWIGTFEHGALFLYGSSTFALRKVVFDSWTSAYSYTGRPAGNSYAVGTNGWENTMTEGEASIIWSPVAGAQVVRGGIGEKYRAMGGAGGSLGFPIENERDPSSGRAYQRFEHGTICWKSYWSFGWQEDTEVVAPGASCWDTSTTGGGGGSPQCTSGYSPPYGCGAGQFCNVVGTGAWCSACGAEGQVCCPGGLGYACALPADVCQGGTPTDVSAAGMCVYHLP
jgi:uncharacterized protein with LGFP repeats